VEDERVGATRTGKKRLDAEAANWKRLSGAISAVVDLQEA